MVPAHLSRSTDPEAVDFYGFVPLVSPNLSEPRHLPGLVDVMRRAFLASCGLGPPVFACTSVPPQHGKTETILHAMSCWLSHRPSDSLAYISYNSDIARDKSRRARDYAKMAGVELREDSRSVETWTTTDNGGVMARGILGGAITGQPGLRLLVIDDPFKNRAEAESRVIRDRVWGEFQSAIVSRLHPTTSVVVNHTRWHPDDLIGRCLKHDPGLWEHINLPAINEDGEALWPTGQPLELLESKRRASGEYEWYSLYQGVPRPRDTQLFQGVAFHDVLPTSRRIAIGVDLAYSAKTSSDWSVAVVMAEHAGRYFVVDVVRRQCSATDFARDLKALHARYAAPMLAYIGGTERGVVDFLRAEGVPIVGKPATTDKVIRATPFSAAWNAGSVTLPSEPTSWREAFVGCLLDFTGLKDPHDDDVDAAAAAFDALASGGAAVYLPPESRDAPRPVRHAGRQTRRVGWSRGGAW